MAALLGLDPTRLLHATPPPAAASLKPGERFKGGHMLATWNHGLVSNAEGWRQMQNGGSALDAVVEGTAVVESDPTGTSVGLGGRPDRSGRVTLDACVMNGPDHEIGSVAGIEGVLHPVTAARCVMERTPHAMLVGQGAKWFAEAQGLETYPTEEA